MKDEIKKMFDSLASLQKNIEKSLADNNTADSPVHQHLSNMVKMMDNMRATMYAMYDDMYASHNKLRGDMYDGDEKLDKQHQDHLKNHPPHLKTASHMQKYLKATGMDNDYDVNKPHITVANTKRGVIVEAEFNQK